MNGEPCLGALEEEFRAAKGSEDCGGGTAVCCCSNEGAEVVDCDVGGGLLKDANAS